MKTSNVYPEPNGEPVAESDLTRDSFFYGVNSLQNYFKNRKKSYVTGNLLVLYEEGVPDAAICPDVCVFFGVEKRSRTSYRVWEENGITPNFVLEITSAKTQNRDDKVNPVIYAKIGVKEYFQYDPHKDYLDPILKGQRLVDGSYQLIKPNVLESGSMSIHSETLGLDICLLSNNSLRFFDPQTGEYLPTCQEQIEHLAFC